MLFKLLSMLAAGKGGAVAAAAIVAGVTTVGVATTPQVQDGVQQVVAAVANVPGMSGLAKAGKIHDCDKGQPLVVAQRNATDKLLRDAEKAAHKELNDLRAGGKDVDHREANKIVNGAQEEVRQVLRTSLNAVAALTLGREGQLKDKDKAEDDETASPSPTATPTATPSATATPTPTPTFSESRNGASPSATPTGSPSPKPTCDPSSTPSPDQTAALTAIVDKAKADMKTIVDETKDALAELEPAERGKSDREKGKDKGDADDEDDDEDGSSEDSSGERGKPEGKGKPSSPPGRSR